MVVDVSNIIKEQGASMDVKLNAQIDDLESNSHKIKFLKPVQVEGTITNLGKILLFEGNIKSIIKTVCDRCLKEFDYNFEININEKFARENSEDYDINLFDGYFIYLDQIIRENIILNLPIRFVCDEECKGLCPKCGVNKNENECDCDEEFIDPRLEKLKNFLK